MTAPATRPRASLSPRTVAALAALVVLAGALASLTPDPIGVFWDDGVYLLTAKALAAGEGFRYAHLPGAPSAIHYPPAFPLLLAALLKVTPEFPANVAVLKLLNPVCLALAVFGAVRLGERTLGLAVVPTALAVAISALIAPVLVLGNVLLSEALFLAVLVGALHVIDAAAARGGTRRAVSAGLAVAAVTLVRTVGGVLLPAAVIALWWRRRRREAVLAAVCAVVALVPWQLFVWRAARGFPDELRGLYGPYLDWVIAGYRQQPWLAVQVLMKNTGDLWRALGIIVAPRLPAAVQWSAAAALVVVLGAGLVALARRRSVLVPFLVLYGGVVMVWPYNPERFVWAVWPLAGLACVAAVPVLGQWGERWWPHASPAAASRAATALVAVLLAGQAAYAARGLAQGWAGAPQRAMTARLWPLVQWSVTHAGPRDVVASDGHVMIALYTGRTTMPVSMLTPAEHLHDKTPSQSVSELGTLVARYHPQLLVLSRGTPETDLIAQWALTPGAPAVVPLAPVPGGGSAFALRERP